MLCVGSGEDGGDRAVLGSPACDGHSWRCPSGAGAARLRRLRAEPRLCGAPPAAAHTRWYKETQGFGPGLRSVAKASLRACQRTRWTGSTRGPKLALPGDVSPADVGVETLGPRCVRLALQAFRAHPGFVVNRWSGTSPTEEFFRLAGTVVAAVSVCVVADGHPSHPSQIWVQRSDVGSPRPITARLTPVLAGRDRRRGREPQARGLGHDHSLRITAIRRGDGSKRYAVSRPTPTPRA